MKVKNRVKRYDEFQKVINFGEQVRSKYLVMYFLKNELNYARVGISIPKKTGIAVLRNKIKRQIRAVLTIELNLDLSYDLIFISRREYDVTNFAQVKHDIQELLAKVG